MSTSTIIFGSRETLGDRPSVQYRTGQIYRLGVIAIVAQLLMVALVLIRLDMLTSAFRQVFYLSCIGFVVNQFLPVRHRLTFFVGLCAATLLLVMGGSPERYWNPRLAITRAVPLALIGGGLIAICLLPISFWLRAALLLVAGGVIAVFRVDILPASSMLVIWPVLASLFMFRLIIFLYDVSTSKTRPRLAQVLAYFFLFPNTCVALFPLVDFKTLCRSHYDGDAMAIYQRGMRWIVRGIVQLLAYRLIHQLLSLEPRQVASGTDLIQFILAGTFVYVQVSGLFHVVIGMLLLFGFNLPETNRRYFLAPSFTEYWRRANIYWKDFMMKVFYYPTFFRLKSRGTTFALTVATLWCFLVTWALHLYQTWWLKGAVTLKLTGVLFWSILALLVLVNSLWEMKCGRKRKLASSGYSIRSALGLCLRTAGTFACIAVLWSLWNTPTLSEWLGLWRYADWHTLGWGAAALAGIMIATVVFEVLPASRAQDADQSSDRQLSPGPIVRSFAVGALPLLLALAVNAPNFQRRLDRPSLQLWHDAINTGDSMMDRLVTRNRGYYERLACADAANAQLWEALMRQRLAYVYRGADPVRPVKDFRFRELIPNVHMQAYDTDFQTNRWGMRDQDYEQAKPPHTLRIALLGASHSMGWGVRHEDVFEAIIERRLNAEPPAGTQGVKFEVLNFSVNGLSPLGEISVLQKQVSSFAPDMVLLVAHSVDYDWVSRDLPRCLREGVNIEYEWLRNILKEARVNGRTHEVFASERLLPYEPALLAWSYRKIVDECRGMQALPAAVFIPLPAGLLGDRRSPPEQVPLLRSSGFAVIDLTHVYDGEDLKNLILPEPSHHSNVRAHRMIADALFEALMSDPDIDLAGRARRISNNSHHHSPMEERP